MRTKHMEHRMRQRNISEEEIAAILEFGEWNPRGDRIVLSRDICAQLEREIRKEITALERKSQKQHLQEQERVEA